ncbi:uncharacterized protein [Paramormyrops kingsleyae]|uniref:uncharacterized protein isoform X2 n=1 Tax=Paramormyrops kingsleyae TaxID=1676925 RepID=UPI000CD64041|nr:uncharacterized protein LOC111860375 isoform X2 [Paramormyrops kingsleyae]
MTSTGHLATNRRDTKEFDSVKESISDIINQLQDIDPARLSFSPFLDLDTQISLAPVSDSPESSVEELQSPSHSVPGSQHSLGPSTAGDDLDRSNSCYIQSHESVTEESRYCVSEKEAKEHIMANDTHTIEGSSEHGDTFPVQAVQGDDFISRETQSTSPVECSNIDSTVDEGSPLMRSPPECIELVMWDSQGQQESGALPAAADRRRCRCCRQCCLTGRVPALCSTLAALLLLPWILYALYFYLPLETPDCPDLVSRLIFTLRCCAVAVLPILLGAVSRFCSASLDPLGECPRRSLFLQLFVTSSVEQLFLYSLNLAVMATFLHQDHMKAVPILSGVFVGGRSVYWLSLHFCSAWRGFGSGLTLFPLLAMVVFNLYCLFDLGLRQLFHGSEDSLYIQTTPSAWPLQIPGQLNYF